MLCITLMLWGICVVTACDSDQDVNREITEGEIEFEVTYPEIDSSSLMLSVLPSTVTLVFKDNKIKTKFRAAAGMFELNLVSDGNDKVLYNMVKLFGDKYALKTDESSDFRVGADMPNFRLLPGSTEVILAGMDCKQIEIDFDGWGKQAFCTTDKVKVEDPNWFTVFPIMESFLMEYTIEQYGIVMHLKAVDIDPKPIEDSEFAIDESDCKMLTEAEFDELIVTNLNVMMESF